MKTTNLCFNPAVETLLRTTEIAEEDVDAAGSCLYLSESEHDFVDSSSLHHDDDYPVSPNVQLRIQKRQGKATATERIANSEKNITGILCPIRFPGPSTIRAGPTGQSK